MPQAVEVKGQAEQQCLSNLQGHATTWCFRRELAFDHRENCFDLRAWPIQLARKIAMHLVADFSLRHTTSWVGGDHAVCSQGGANVTMVGFRVKLRVGQHQTDGS